MNELATIQIQVQAATAEALADAQRLKAVGRLIERLVRPTTDDPLIALLERISTEAQAAGLTQAEIDAELAAHNAERRD
jgi:hypothetical protein